MSPPAPRARPLRVAWLHSHFLHLHSGGTQFVCSFADALQRDHGCRVELAVDVAAEDARRSCAERGLPLRELDRASTNSPWYWLTLHARVRRRRAQVAPLVQGADVVVSSMFPMDLVARDAGRPHVQICFEPFAFFHDEACLAALRPAERLFFRAMARLHAGADRAAVRSADRVVTVNATNVPRFEAVYGLRPDVVYLGYDAAFWRRPGADELAAFRRRFGPGPLLFHSTDLSGIKGSFELLAVVERLARLHPTLRLLVTVYVDNASARRRFDEEIAARRLGERVTVLGRVDRDALPSIYGAVDLVVQPGPTQPANGTLREALLCETPIVGGPVSEEVVEGRNGTRVDVRDPDAAAERIAALLRGKRELDLVAAGRELIAARFPFARSVEDLHRILVEVVDRAR